MLRIRTLTTLRRAAPAAARQPPDTPGGRQPARWQCRQQNDTDHARFRRSMFVGVLPCCGSQRGPRENFTGSRERERRSRIAPHNRQIGRPPLRPLPGTGREQHSRCKLSVVPEYSVWRPRRRRRVGSARRYCPRGTSGRDICSLLRCVLIMGWTEHSVASGWHLGSPGGARSAKPIGGLIRSLQVRDRSPSWAIACCYKQAEKKECQY